MTPEGFEKDSSGMQQTLEEQKELFAGLTSPYAIQAFLDETTYSAEDTNRCPVRVMKDRQAHCLDGAVFAAAALRRLGFPPLVVDLFPEPGTDDDHVLAIYRQNGGYGAVAKSNYTGLRFREPVYRTLRELIMSYFDSYFNVNGQKTLRTYTRPVNLAKLDQYNWMETDEGVDVIERYLLERPRLPLLNSGMIASLSPVHPLTLRAGMLVANEAGLYKPK
jgi:hypothetical protein